MDAAKIRLSPEEAELVMRADVILTKNRIIQKTMVLLGGLQEKQWDILAATEDRIAGLNALPGKISRGENYKGLPYLILDQPRIFEKEHILSIRTLFWWGNFFSTTLQLSGRYKIQYEEKILSRLDELKDGDFSICTNDEQWEHHFEEGNYTALRQLDTAMARKMIGEKTFIKLAKRTGFDQWETSEEKLLDIFTRLVRVLAD
jgi:hypothetical protein